MLCRMKAFLQVLLRRGTACISSRSWLSRTESVCYMYRADACYCKDCPGRP